METPIEKEHRSRGRRALRRVMKGPGVQGIVDQKSGSAANGRLHYRAQITDLRPLARISKSGPLAGSLTLDGSASGRLDAMDASATLDARHLLVNNTRLAALRAQLNARAIGTTRGAADLSAEALDISMSGRSFTGARVTAGWKGAGFTPSETSIDLLVRQDDKHEHRVRANVDMQPQEMRLALRDLVLQLGEDTWRNKGIAQIRYRGERVAVSNFELRSDRGQLTVDGEGGTAGNQNLTLTVRELDLAPFLSGQPGDFKGRVSARAHLAGTAKVPQLDAEISIEQPTVKNVRCQTARANLHLARGRVESD